MASYLAIIVFTGVVAVVLDILIMVWLRRAYLQRRGEKLVGGVYLFRTYSPGLTWLKKFFTPILKKRRHQLARWLCY